MSKISIKQAAPPLAIVIMHGIVGIFIARHNLAGSLSFATALIVLVFGMIVSLETIPASVSRLR